MPLAPLRLAGIYSSCGMYYPQTNVSIVGIGVVDKDLHKSDSEAGEQIAGVCEPPTPC